MAAEADEFEVRVSVTLRFAAFNDREALRHTARIYTAFEKVVPYVRRKWNIDLSHEFTEPSRTGRHRRYHPND